MILAGIIKADTLRTTQKLSLKISNSIFVVSTPLVWNIDIRFRRRKQNEKTENAEASESKGFRVMSSMRSRKQQEWATTCARVRCGKVDVDADGDDATAEASSYEGGEFREVFRHFPPFETFSERRARLLSELLPTPGPGNPLSQNNS